MPGIVLVTWAGFHFHSDPLMLDHTIYFTKKCSKSAKGNPIFHLKGRRATRLGLTDLDSLNFCLEFFYFPRFRPSNFGYLPFREKFAFFKDSSNAVFVFFSTTCGKSFSKIGPYLEEFRSHGPKTPQNGPFHGCSIATKTFQIF